MKLSDEMKEWCQSPRTREAVKFFEETVLKQHHEELLQACGKSTDPNVRASYSAYFMALHMLAQMRGNQ